MRSATSLLLAACTGLVLATGCHHAQTHSPAPSSPSPGPQPSPAPGTAERPVAETLRVRLKEIGEEIAAASARIDAKLKPEVEALERKHDEITRRLEAEGAAVTKHVEQAVDHLEDEVRALRSHLFGGDEPSKDDGKDDSE